MVMIEESTCKSDGTGIKVVTESFFRISTGKFPLELWSELRVGLNGFPPLSGKGIGFFPVPD